MPNAVETIYTATPAFFLGPQHQEALKIQAEQRRKRVIPSSKRVKIN